MNRPHPEFQDVTVSGMNDGHIWYNGLQVDYDYHIKHGVSFNTSFVWSKQIEQWGWLSQDLNLRQRSVYYLELPKAFKIDGVFQLPFGRTRHFNMANNRIADAFVGGWDFSPMFTLQSGEPVALPSGARPLPHNKFNRNPNWSNRNPIGFLGWGHCVLHHLAGGGVQPLPTNTAYGSCPSDLSQYDWIVYDTLPNEAIEGWNSDVIASLRRRASADRHAVEQFHRALRASAAAFAQRKRFSERRHRRQRRRISFNRRGGGHLLQRQRRAVHQD
jgi:hypothetical protein